VLAKDVQIRLRKLGEPITLFGERAPGRRERLRGILTRLAVENASKLAALSTFFSLRD
jgi:U4/U6 small nuclear ribonucleoprotein PRP4